MDSVSLLGTFVSLLFGLVLSGSIPSLETINDPSSSFYQFRSLWALSPSRYFVENMYILETAGRDWEELQGDVLRYSYDRRNFKRNVVSLGLMVITVFVIAFFALKLKGRSNQK